MALKHEEDLIELNLEVSDGSISSFKIFVETFLGFGKLRISLISGANEAKRRYLKDKLNHIKSGVIQDNCRLKGHQDLEGGKAVLGTGDYAQCINDLSKLLNKDLPCDDDPCYFNGVHIPTSSFSRFKLVGVSEFWYTSTNIYDLGGTYNSTAFLSTFKRICSSNWTDFKENSDIFDDLYSLDPLFVEEQCFKSSWIYTFLHYGLHLKHQKYSQLDSSNVEFLNKIGDMEVVM
jgi:Golgi apyrase